MKYLWVFFLISSCSFFQKSESLDRINPQRLVQSIKLTGEGKGRLSVGPKKYVFSQESFLNKNHDWMMTVMIPFQGEEVLIFHDLRNPGLPDDDKGQFEKRIEDELIKMKFKKDLALLIIKEIRSLIRFGLASELNTKPACDFNQTPFTCELDGELFFLSVSDNKLSVSREIKNLGSVYLISENFYQSIFLKSSISFYYNQSLHHQDHVPFSLEFFW